MARAQGARARMALAFETTYGTPPGSGYTRMPFASTSLGAEQPLLNSELLGYGRDPLAPIKDAVTADGDVFGPGFARGGGAAGQSLLEIQSAIDETEGVLRAATARAEQARFGQRIAQIALQDRAR